MTFFKLRWTDSTSSVRRIKSSFLVNLLQKETTAMLYYIIYINHHRFHLLMCEIWAKQRFLSRQMYSLQAYKTHRKKHYSNIVFKTDTNEVGHYHQNRPFLKATGFLMFFRIHSTKWTSWHKWFIEAFAKLICPWMTWLPFFCWQQNLQGGDVHKQMHVFISRLRNLH